MDANPTKLDIPACLGCFERDRPVAQSETRLGRHLLKLPNQLFTFRRAKESTPNQRAERAIATVRPTPSLSSLLLGPVGRVGHPVPFSARPSNPVFTHLTDKFAIRPPATVSNHIPPPSVTSNADVWERHGSAKSRQEAGIDLGARSVENRGPPLVNK